MHKAQFFQAANYERLEQRKRHFLRQAALVQLQVRSDDDNRTARIVDALSQQVLAEAALFALEHVGYALERAIAGAGHWPAVAAVVEKGVYGFLEHALLVVDNDVGRLHLHEAAQAVVAVDYAAVKVVEVASGESAAFQRDQRAQIRRNNGQHFKYHPFRTGSAFYETLHELKAL
ncbi:predicted protein [Coraliomargarita sp. CAG:312]|nr:predicted protein [Coraliomargarita sp. CAG:312]